MLEVKTVNKEMYIDILHHFRDSVRRKCPEKWRINFTTMLQHTGQFWSRILAKNNVKTLEHLPYSPDLAPADF